MAPRWAWWVTFFAILIIIAIFTGRFGGAVFGVIAGGIASWIVDDLWTNRIRARNKALSIEEVIADSRNTMLTWSDISHIKLKKYINIETAYDRKYKTNVLVSEDLKAFLISKLHDKVIDYARK